MKGHYLDPPIVYACLNCKATATWRTQTMPKLLLCTCGQPMIATDKEMPAMSSQPTKETTVYQIIADAHHTATYTIACPHCHNEQTAFAPETTLDEIRTSAAGLAAMAHNPGCPLYHNGRANASDLQAPLF